MKSTRRKPRARPRFSQRARRASRPGEAEQAWDRAIDVWEDFVEAGKDWSRDRVHGPALLQAIGTVRGLRVLDVGCGQGHLARILARRGATVTGIDWSRRMIERAREHELRRPLGIAYQRLDARRLSHGAPRPRFDLAVAAMSLMDMPDVGRVFHGVFRALRPGGTFVFSISHPVNSSAVRWEHPGRQPRGGLVIDRYFEERPGILEWRMTRLLRPFRTPYWHRTLETWFALARRSGFEVVALDEPRPSLAAVRAFPLLDGSRRVPFYMTWVCQKRRGARPAGLATRKTGRRPSRRRG